MVNDNLLSSINTMNESTLTFEKIKKELDKCIVLCANCHRKEHVKDFN